MSRAELIDTAIKKLDEAAMLLMAAGEDRLAADAEELAEWVEFKALPHETEDAQKRMQQLRN